MFFWKEKCLLVLPLVRAHGDWGCVSRVQLLGRRPDTAGQWCKRALSHQSRTRRLSACVGHHRVDRLLESRAAGHSASPLSSRRRLIHAHVTLLFSNAFATGFHVNQLTDASEKSFWCATRFYTFEFFGVLRNKNPKGWVLVSQEEMSVCQSGKARCFHKRLKATVDGLQVSNNCRFPRPNFELPPPKLILLSRNLSLWFALRENAKY